MSWVELCTSRARLNDLDRLCARFGELVFTRNLRRVFKTFPLRATRARVLFRYSVELWSDLGKPLRNGTISIIPSPPPFSKDISLACAAFCVVIDYTRSRLLSLFLFTITFVRLRSVRSAEVMSSFQEIRGSPSPGQLLTRAVSCATPRRAFLSLFLWRILSSFVPFALSGYVIPPKDPKPPYLSHLQLFVRCTSAGAFRSTAF